ncbi:MAG: methyltransferase [Marinobacter sp.]|uniref:methyltransferase family protein n=1 Tax=Marinobacter sp. TaxID=50741 RepID=UPI00299E1988|nr:methyltransferase [Marinobacter sp.]MDX1634391.1 methyltransferase [Marinobacter sp.]
MSSVDLFVRHFLGIYFLMIGLHYTSRSLGLYDRMRFSHIHYGHRGSGPWWHRHIFNLFRASILAICLVRMVWDIDPYLGVFPFLYQPAVLMTGVFCLLASFYLIDYVQAYMHEDWRSGIDGAGGKHLITEGPFRKRRNPLFLAIMLGQLGFFLALPSVFTLLCLVVGVFVITRQARAEESALEQHFGDLYRRYVQRTRRWL